MSRTAKLIVGGMGALLVAAGVVATIWGMMANKDVNSVGLAAIFVTGIAFLYGGVFGLVPDEIGFDKAKIKMQAAADAVKAIKEAANSQATAIAQSPDVIDKIVSAQDKPAAAAAVEGALKELVSRMPATADVIKDVA